MALIERVLPAQPVTDLSEHVERFQGGRALEAATKLEAVAILDELDAAGLRGRGGAGFPTGRKWRTVVDNRSDVIGATVVVNGAEGEPGTFKDRAILRANPYQVIEGALVAAKVVGADTVVFALKATFAEELARLRGALSEATEAGWCDGVQVEVFEGPAEYLYGEETALLEAIAGRAPLPRIAPPYRRGVDEVVEAPGELASESGLAAAVDMAGEEAGNVVPPTLVDNVETLANIPHLLVRGSEWFRSAGTTESPGTIVCTITGRVERPGVAEIALGTTLREAIEEIGGGAREGHQIRAVLPGVSNALLPADALDTPLTYEAMAAAGSGLGSAGYIVLDDTDDLVAVAAGVSRFLAVESCGQCTPCKQDGLEMAEVLSRVAGSDADEHDIERLLEAAGRVTDGARCNLAAQQQAVVLSAARLARREITGHLDGTRPAAGRFVVAELVALDEDGGTTIDLRHDDKQPDWTYDEVDSGQAPADRLGEHRDDISEARG
jgi:NADH:ubiquinone oxidoreductase subunit F (NADH-binding)